MKKSPKLLTVLAATFAASFALTACGGGINDPEDDTDDASGSGVERDPDATVLTYSTQHTENTPFSRGTQRWAELVEERTEGRVAVDISYSESLLPADEVLPGIIDGRASAGFVVDTMFPNQLPLTNSSAIPFDRQNGVAQARAFQELYTNNADYRAEFEDLGVHVLMFQVPGSTHIGSRDAIEDLDDLSGQDIRCIGYICDSLQAVGANPVALASTDIYEAMDRATVDGWAAYPFMDMIAAQFQEVTPYVTDPGIGMYLQTFSPINLEVWNSLESQDQEVLEELAVEYHDIMAEEIHDLEIETCEATTAEDVTLSEMSEEDAEEWREAVHDDVYDTWVDLASGGDVDPDAFYADLMDAYEAALQTTDFESLYAECMDGTLVD